MKKIFIAAASAGAVLVFAAPAAAQHEGGAFIRNWDGNGDGAVTRAEFAATRTTRFEATDTNKDGWVSDIEYLAEYQARLESELRASGMSEEKKAEERQRQIRQTHVRFGVLDTDKDGKMQKAEYDASGARAFDGMDDDKDAIVAPGDVAAIAARRAARSQSGASD
jgi:hypothetical protein